jgi:hypothetical protein
VPDPVVVRRPVGGREGGQQLVDEHPGILAARK